MFNRSGCSIEHSFDSLASGQNPSRRTGSESNILREFKMTLNFLSSRLPSHQSQTLTVKAQIEKCSNYVILWNQKAQSFPYNHLLLASFSNSAGSKG